MHQQVPLLVKISLIPGIIAGVATIVGHFIMPIIFNFFIIPKIEKRFERKIEFSLAWNYIFLGHFFFNYLEMAIPIAYRCLAWKMKGDPDAYLGGGICRKDSKLALNQVDYDVKTAPKFEIVMSIIAAVNILTVLVCFLIIFMLLLFI